MVSVRGRGAALELSEAAEVGFDRLVVDDAADVTLPVVSILRDGQFDLMPQHLHQWL